MFKRLSLGAKIASGFAVVLLTALALGLFAFISTSGIVSSSKTLSDEYMPMVKAANSIERNYRIAMAGINLYTLTGNKELLSDSMAALEDVKTNLDTSESMAARFNNLKEFRQPLGVLKTDLSEYEGLITKTTEIEEQISKNFQDVDAAAKEFLKICNFILTTQKNQIVLSQFSKEEGATSDIADKVQKIHNVNSVIALGNDVRIASWQLQASQNLDAAAAALKKFTTLGNKLKSVKNDKTAENDAKKVEEGIQVANRFKSSLTLLHGNWTEMMEVAANRDSLAVKVLEGVEKVTSMGIDNTTESAKGTTGVVSASANTIVIGLLIALGIGIVISMTITRNITASIRKVITGLTQSSEQLNSAAHQVASSSQSMAEGASKQASSLEEVSSSLEEMSSMTKQNADNAKEANSLAENARTSATSGNDAMVRMNDAINRIKTSADETAKIVKTIDEIAFQTNLLALNAAVEAARAGEAGKGFAVVAEEVRSLAQRSAEAAKNTSELIQDSQANSENGVKVSNEVASTLSEIVEASNKVSSLVSEVAAASEEQAQGIEQINGAVAHMDQVTQSNAANAEESSSASQELSSQSRDLSNIVSSLVALVAGLKSARNGVQQIASKDGNGGRPNLKDKLLASAGKTKKVEAAKAAAAAPAAAPVFEAVAAKEVKPEQVIPMDDEELTDF